LTSIRFCGLVLSVSFFCWYLRIIIWIFPSNEILPNCVNSTSFTSFSVADFVVLSKLFQHQVAYFDFFRDSIEPFAYYLSQSAHSFLKTLTYFRYAPVFTYFL
jgi:hypothetical protein